MEKSSGNSSSASYAQFDSKTGVSTMGSRPHTTFASLSMHENDRLRLLQFSSDETQTIRDTISISWPNGIQSERDYYGSHEFKLRGNPWYGSGDDAVFARRFMTRVFETLANIGWVLTVSADLSKKTTDKDTLFFRYQQPPPAPCEWMTISFSNQDLLRLIDAPQSLVSYMVQHLAPFIQRHQPHKNQPEAAYEFKINGYPWDASGSTTVESRRLVLRLLEGLDMNGWTVYGRIPQSTSQSGRRHVSRTSCLLPRHSLLPKS